MIFGLSPKNFFDLAIIFIFVYLLLFFLLRRRRAFFVVLGILFWYFVFFISSYFNLPVTNFIFKWFVGFGLLLFIILVLAQEIRDFLYFSGSLGFKIFKYFKEREFAIPENTVKIVSEAVKEMAEKRVGAILVFEGSDPLAEFVSGGYLLQGTISKPLLLSIFDPTSPGHDGAVIIKDNKIQKFSVHLPLSHSFEKVGEHNLRHRAGLGISELTDCLVVIVSEEKGTISIAQNGKLEKVENVFELQERLLDFLKKPIKRVLPLEKSLLRHLGIFLISLIFSLSLFSFISKSYFLIQKSFIVPVEFTNLPSHLVVKEFKPSEVTITLKGEKFTFDTLNINDLRLVIDLKDYSKYSVSKWNSISVEDKDISIKLPKNLTIVNISPSNIRFLLEKIGE